jgi:mono/diheme cytochrome c family protein
MSDERGRPVADLDSAEHFMQELRTAHLQLEVVAERQDRFLGSANEGIAFLEKALEDRAWDVDFEEVATRTGLDLAGATRAVGLFNAYCARCHTAGYSAGVAFEQAAGSGAWAPALRDGRAVTQFPSFDDHVAFVIRGAQADSHYGVNGLSGVGGMPAFGEILSQDDIELIVTYERSL